MDPNLTDEADKLEDVASKVGDEDLRMKATEIRNQAMVKGHEEQDEAAREREAEKQRMRDEHFEHARDEAAEADELKRDADEEARAA